MKKSEISIRVLLDENNIPDKIGWSASDDGDDKKEARAMNVSFWDGLSRETLKMDLWTKDMPVQEMKMFYIDIIGSMSETLLHATGDEKLTSILKEAGKNMMTHVEKQVDKN